MRHLFLAVLVSVVAVWSSSCAGLLRDDSLVPTLESTSTRVGGIEFHLLEHAHDDSYYLPAGAPHSIDYQSTLVLEFETLPDDLSARPDPQWLAVNQWLAAMKTSSTSRLETEAQLVKLAADGNVGEFRRVTGEFNNALVQLQRDAERVLRADFGFDDAAIKKLQRTKDANGKTLPAEVNYGNYFEEKYEGLLRQARARRNSGAERMVRVLAFRRVKNGNQERLHVENYDNIASSSETTIPRFSLSLSPEQLSKLKAELQQSENAARALRSVKGDLSKLETQRRALVHELKKALTSVRTAVTNSAQLQAEIPAAITYLEGLNAGRPEGAKLDALIAALKELQGVQQLEADLDDLVSRYTALFDADLGSSFAELMLGAHGIAATAKNLVSEGKTLFGDAGKKMKAIGTVVESVSLLEGAELAEFRVFLPAPAERAMATYLETVDPWIRLIRSIGDSFAAASGGNEFFQDYVDSAELAQGAEAIDRRPDRLLDGRITLNGVAEPGDEIVVRIELRDQSGARVVDAREYLLPVNKEGMHPSIVGRAILARGTTGDSAARSWEPNVAALASLNYHERYPNWWGEVSNVLAPAIGLHAASLDQGDENVEFGIGLNLTLFHGLFSIGAGSNLSIEGEDDKYVFVATDLFQLLGNPGAD